jgi:type VI secretion system protein ImpI
VAPVPTGVRIVVSDTLNNAVLVDKSFARLPVRIGRNELNDLAVSNGYISQFHAVLDLDGGRLVVRDLGSTNGTLFGGQRIPPNEATPIPEEGFAIMALRFQLTKMESVTAPAVSNRKPMAVTGLLQGPDRNMLLLLAQAPRQNLEAIRGQYAAYRASWSELLRTIYRQAGELPEEQRGSFYAQLNNEFPALVHEEDFKRIAPALLSQGAQKGPTPDALALAGLKELASDFAPNRPPPESADDVVQFLSKLAETLDVFMKCFIPLRDGYQQLATELGVKSSRQQTMPPGVVDVRSGVAHARDKKELSHHLLNFKDRTSEASSAVESVFADYMIHQVAMMNGVMNGVKSLLSELSPTTVEETAQKKKRSLGFGPLRFRGLWELYREMHADFADEDRHVFSLLFGRKFAEAYDRSRGAGMQPKSSA